MDEHSADQPIAYGFYMWVTQAEHCARLKCLYVNITAQKHALKHAEVLCTYNETCEC